MNNYIQYIVVFMFIIILSGISFGQVNWTKDTHNNPFLVPGEPGTWNDVSGYPFCVLLQNNFYHMWSGGYDGKTPRIGYFSSADGINFSPFEKNPILDKGATGSWESDGILTPYVLYKDGIYHMWYAGYNAMYTRIGYATSPDSINWTKYENNPVLGKGSAGSWDSREISNPSVYFDGSTYHMWYEGWNGSATRIGYATSTDGIKWSKYAGNPVLVGNIRGWDRNVGAPEVVFDGTMYHMWYNGFGTTSGRHWRVGYAISVDGMNWTKYADNPVLKPSAGSWDSQWTGYARVLWDSLNNEFKMWYGGGSDNVAGKLGFAKAPLTIRQVPAHYATIQQGIDAADSADVVLVAEGTYYENISFKGKAITVASQYWFDGDTSHISKTIIDGSQPADPTKASVVSFVSGEDSTSVLSGFTITGGTGTYNKDYDGIGGGGIYMLAGGKIIHNIITDNHLENTGLTGGAGLLQIAQNNNYYVIIKDNVFTNNSFTSHSIIPSAGGGIYCLWEASVKGNLKINNNTVSYNSGNNTGRYKAIAGGVGLSIYYPKLVNAVVENNLITHNELHCQASMGAGIYVVYWEPGGQFEDLVPGPVIRNNIIANNYSQDRGAGIGIWTVQKNHSPNTIINPQPAIINNTIVNNIAKDGSGIFNFDSYPLLLNNILWNNLSMRGSREIFNNDIKYPDYTDTNEGEVNIYYTDIQGGWEGKGNIYANPGFEDSLFHLSDTSWCVGNGTDSIEINRVWYRSPVTDYFGNTRPNPKDLAVDIGAVESQYDSVVVSIGRIRDEITPLKFALYQNYPNPFNPKTTIEYSVRAHSNVPQQINLSIYNLLGQKVATLVDKKQAAGNYKVKWDASGFSSGVYLYRLETSNGFTQTRKLIFLK